ncbi:MAG: hypothetical protein WC484_03290 [Candidatus Omnitrophota bacterium]
MSSVGYQVSDFKKDLKMEISNQLVRPFIDKIGTEWQDLYREISDHESDEARALRSSIEQRIRQLEKFRVSIRYSEQNNMGLKEFPNLREALRLLKFDLRTTRRKWHRYLISKICTQKRQEQTNHGVSFVS